MSTLENVIDGLNDVKCRIKLAISKREPVSIYNLFILKLYFFGKIGKLHCYKLLFLEQFRTKASCS